MRKFDEKQKFEEKAKNLFDFSVAARNNEVADFEATTFSIFYNNAFYLLCLIVLSFFVFKNFSPTVNYLFSVGLSTAIVFLFSTGQK